MKAPDGKLVLHLISLPPATNKITTVGFPFERMKHWFTDTTGIVIVYPVGRHGYPWHRIWEYEVFNNSEEYIKEQEDKASRTCKVDSHRHQYGAVNIDLWDKD